jgi:hypothetical protein
MELTFFNINNKLVQFVIHPSCARGESNTLDSEISAHQICLKTEVLPDVSIDNEPCYPFHQVI